MNLHPKELSGDELCTFMEVINKTNYMCGTPNENKCLVTSKNEKEEKKNIGIIRVPEVVFDYWLHHLSLVEFKVLICFFRKEFCDGHLWSTYVEQIEMLTGLSKGEIYICLQVFHKRGIIIKTPNFTKDSKNDDECYAIDIIVLYKSFIPIYIVPNQ